MNENSDPFALQEFVDEGGLHLTLPTYPCDDFDKPGERYILWSDIWGNFPGIDHLKELRHRRTLYMVDQDFKLYVRQT